IAAYQSGWAGAMLQNLKAWGFATTASLLMYVFSIVPLMMLGMGLFKAGFFHGRVPTWIYLALIAGGATVLTLLGVL
ncbi:hypothetical protein, partial [Klebsiella quasipneumoniae]